MPKRSERKYIIIPSPRDFLKYGKKRKYASLVTAALNVRADVFLLGRGRMTLLVYVKTQERVIFLDLNTILDRIRLKVRADRSLFIKEYPDYDIAWNNYWENINRRRNMYPSKIDYDDKIDHFQACCSASINKELFSYVCEQVIENYLTELAGSLGDYQG